MMMEVFFPLLQYWKSEGLAGSRVRTNELKHFSTVDVVYLWDLFTLTLFMSNLLLTEVVVEVGLHEFLKVRSVDCSRMALSCDR